MRSCGIHQKGHHLPPFYIIQCIVLPKWILGLSAVCLDICERSNWVRARTIMAVPRPTCWWYERDLILFHPSYRRIAHFWTKENFANKPLAVSCDTLINLRLTWSSDKICCCLDFWTDSQTAQQLEKTHTNLTWNFACVKTNQSGDDDDVFFTALKSMTINLNWNEIYCCMESSGSRIFLIHRFFWHVCTSIKSITFW